MQSRLMTILQNRIELCDDEGTPLTNENSQFLQSYLDRHGDGIFIICTECNRDQSQATLTDRNEIADPERDINT